MRAGSCRPVHREVRRPSLARHPRRRRAGSARPGRRARPDRSPAPPRSTPPTRDRRFTDAAWTDNPLLQPAGAGSTWPTGGPLEQLVADADLDWRDAERVRFLVENLVEALAPSNVPLLNPASAKAAIDTAGAEPGPRRRATWSGTWPPRRGSRRWWTPRGFQVGENLAATPGAVVLPHRGAGADPVPAADRAGPRGAAADRAADHQQVLRAGPGARAQPGRVPASSRASRCS